MSTDPDELRAQIDETRARMSHDVNELTDYAAPANVAHRQADKVRGAVGSAATNVRERVMGQVSSVADSASTASDAVSGAPDAVTSRTRGNPLAAGLIALGAGWLLGSLLPASSKETQAAAAVKNNASTLTQPLVDAAKEAASNLQEPAKQAAQAVKDSAVDSAETVRQEGASAAQEVAGHAPQAGQSARNS